MRLTHSRMPLALVPSLLAPPSRRLRGVSMNRICAVSMLCLTLVACGGPSDSEIESAVRSAVASTSNATFSNSGLGSLTPQFSVSEFEVIQSPKKNDGDGYVASMSYTVSMTGGPIEAASEKVKVRATLTQLDSGDWQLSDSVALP